MIDMADKTFLTVEQYAALGEDPPLVFYELSNGELIVTPAPHCLHNEMRFEFFARLRPFIEPRGLGKVMLGMDFQLGEATSRRPDVAFISNERLRGVDLAKVPLRAVPELAIEIVCNERADDLMKKVVQYLEAGVLFVWVFYPELRLAHRSVPSKAVLETFSAADNFTEPELLPGFTLKIAEILNVSGYLP